MNNEPVAWMLLGLEDRKPKLINLQVIEHLEGTWIPLYTHPADLTDEEIDSLADEFGAGMEQFGGCFRHVDFARAIEMIYRDIEELKIWGNDNGMRFHRDPDDKTKYKVYFTDDDIDKLESFVRQQQAEIEAAEQQVLDAFERGKMFGYAQGLRKAQEK